MTNKPDVHFYAYREFVQGRNEEDVVLSVADNLFNYGADFVDVSGPVFDSESLRYLIGGIYWLSTDPVVTILAANSIAPKIWGALMNRGYRMERSKVSFGWEVKAYDDPLGAKRQLVEAQQAVNQMSGKVVKVKR